MCYFCTHAHKILLQRKDKLRTVHPIQLYNTKKFINFFLWYYTILRKRVHSTVSLKKKKKKKKHKKELRVLRFIVALSDFSH